MPNEIKISGIPYEFGQPSTIVLNRGADPFKWDIISSTYNYTSYQALAGNPISIVITDSHDKELKLENWFVTQIRPHPSTLIGDPEPQWEVSIQDVRWKLSYGWFQKSYNIVTVDDRVRYDARSTASNSKWTVLDAAKDALQIIYRNAHIRHDNPVLIDSEAERKFGKVLLPDNWGDSDAGGYVAGSIYDVERMLELVRCDMVVQPNGAIKFVERSSDQSKGVEGTPAFAGAVHPNYISTRPKNIVVVFEQRIERVFDYETNAATRTAPPTKKDKKQLYVENVAPLIDAASFPVLRQSGEEAFRWMALEDFVLAKINKSYLEFLQKRFKDSIVEPLLPAIDYELARKYEIIARDSLYSTWRVDLDVTDAGRVYSQLRFGRLSSRGNSLPNRYVFCDWSEITEYPWNRPVNYRDGDYSKRHEVVTLSEAQFGPEAPFTCNWVANENYDLVFKLTPLRLPSNINDIMPGLIYSFKGPNQNMGFGDVKKLADGSDEVATKREAGMGGDFKMRVYYNALLASNIPAENVNRLYENTQPGFPDGNIPVVRIRVSDMTANWGHDDILFPGILLNKQELEDRSKAIAEQVVATYSKAPAGTIQASGIGVLLDRYPKGNLYQASINIGHDQPYTINTSLLFIPEVRTEVRPNVSDLNGSLPELIG